MDTANHKWNGESLGTGPIALVLFTVSCSGNSPELIFLATASNGDASLNVPVDRLGRFLHVHRNNLIRLQDLQTSYRPLKFQLERGAYPEGMEVLNTLVAENRLVDVRVLTSLHIDATGTRGNGTVTPEGFRPVAETVEQVRPDLMNCLAQSWEEWEEALRRRVLQIPAAIAKTNGPLAEAYSTRAGASAGAPIDFGPLGVGIHVRGAVAIAEAGSGVWRIDEQQPKLSASCAPAESSTPTMRFSRSPSARNRGTVELDLPSRAAVACSLGRSPHRRLGSQAPGG